MFDGRRTREATAACTGCGVREVCLWETLRREVPGERYGVAGGTSPREREVLAELIPEGALATAYRTAVAAWHVRSGSGEASALVASWPAGGLRPRHAHMGKERCVDGTRPRGDVAEAQAPSGVAADAVETVAVALGVPGSELRGRSRQRHLVEARQVAMYALREGTDLSLPAIGRALGGRDHTTVMHGLERIRQRLPHSPTLRDCVARVLEVVDGTRPPGDVAEAQARKATASAA